MPAMDRVQAAALAVQQRKVVIFLLSVLVPSGNVIKLRKQLNCTTLQGSGKRKYYPFRALDQIFFGLKPMFFC